MDTNTELRAFLMNTVEECAGDPDAVRAAVDAQFGRPPMDETDFSWDRLSRGANSGVRQEGELHKRALAESEEMVANYDPAPAAVRIRQQELANLLFKMKKVGAIRRWGSQVNASSRPPPL
jgi:hypothetical protein